MGIEGAILYPTKPGGFRWLGHTCTGSSTLYLTAAVCSEDHRLIGHVPAHDPTSPKGLLPQVR